MNLDIYEIGEWKEFSEFLIIFIINFSIFHFNRLILFLFVLLFNLFYSFA